MSFIFWALLTVSIAFTVRFVYSLTAEVRRYRRHEHTSHFKELEDLHSDQDDLAFFGRWMLMMWSFTVVWSVLEIGVRVLRSGAQ